MLGVAGDYFSDPSHFTWQTAVAAAIVGGGVGLTGYGLSKSYELGAAANITINVASNALAASGGSVLGNYLSGQPINWPSAGEAGLIGGVAPLLSGEAAVAGLVNYVSPTADALLDAYMSTTTLAIACPVEAALANTNGNVSNSESSGDISGLGSFHFQ